MTALIHADPFRQLRAMHDEFNRMFDRSYSEGQGMMTEWPLRVDIREDKEAITIRADVPGMQQEDITVHLDQGQLTLSGERKFEDEARQEDYHRVERAYGRFSRTFQLPTTTDVERVDASYTNGVLEVVLPKKEEAKPRAIEVKVK
ncbi:MAG: Hsp20/alpha crystallin family protein [Magnetococcales bacterium]|nr:Hsp20/alpha crystallin family protein [Magnetococcales bacterium]